MDKYVCSICGYVYDPEQGDPDNGVAPGTKFEDLPDDWECPVCGASKDDFEKQNIEEIENQIQKFQTLLLTMKKEQNKIKKYLYKEILQI